MCVRYFFHISFYILIIAFRFLYRSHFVLPIIRLNKDYYPGEKFVIEAKKQAVGDCYLQDISLNNRPQDTVQLPFSEVVKGGKLVLGLGASPNEELTH